MSGLDFPREGGEGLSPSGVGAGSPVAPGWRYAMTLDFENFSVEIDAEATRRAYEGVHRVDEGCGCAGCRNFTLAIGDGLGEGGRRFLASVGIDDPAKATESYVNFVQRDGTLCYGGWCHL